MRRLALAIIIALTGLAAYGQDKPSAAIHATAPTQSVSDLPSAHPALAAPAGSANVAWNGSLLTIAANGDSMRNILRAISQATGMKITGGVPEEQVFGSYGPGAVQDVLPQLFDGIAVNMMLVNDGPTRPKELVLTQRTGAVTPPQTRPIADEDQGLRRHGGFGQPRNDPPGGSPRQTGPQLPQAQLPSPSQMPQTGAIAPASAPADGATAAMPGATTPGMDASGQPQSPNGVRTPEQIFEELRKRQQNAASQ